MVYIYTIKQYEKSFRYYLKVSKYIHKHICFIGCDYHISNNNFNYKKNILYVNIYYIVYII